MAQFRPFKGIRPKTGLAERVASLPYDVMDRAEAKKMADGNGYSFLHVSRSEIDLDDSTSPYSEDVYKTAGKNLDSMMKNGILLQDNIPKFYIYRQIMQGRAQTGVVGCASIDDYLNETIKKHELTRLEKELDRICHFYSCNAHTEPVFLTYRKNDAINDIICNWTDFNAPVYHFTSEDGIIHIVWDVDDVYTIQKTQSLFASVDYLYIADGHHRSASSVKVGLKRRENAGSFSGKEEFNFFMAVAFPDKDLYIMDYNRLIRDLNGYTTEEFLSKVRERFTVEETGSRFKPFEKRTFGMFLENKWYKLSVKPGSYDPDNVIEQLDVSILQNNLLYPVLGIKDPRTDKRIDFVGGIRGLGELEKRVHSDMKIAFAMFPTTMDDLLSVADSGSIMPPKSTWFEPKLRSGLFIHRF